MRRYVLLSCALLLSAVVFNGQGIESKVVKVRTLNVRDILYLLTSGNINSLALMRDEGVVLIDAGLPGWDRAMHDSLSAVSDQPITIIINTSADAERAGGNPGFPTATRIIAQENARASMLKMDELKGSNAKFLPSETVKDKLTLLDGQDRMDLYYFGPAHTNGDLVVVFPEKHLAYLGDVFPGKAAPSIDVANGGSGVAFPQTLAKAIAEIHGVNRVVTGIDQGVAVPRNRSTAQGSVILSNPLTFTWADFQEYADFNRDFLSAVREAMNAGKSAEEAAANLNLPEKYKNYDFQHAKANVEAIYQELKK
jgi:cyclase